MIAYSRLYADSQGVTHFADEHIEYAGDPTGPALRTPWTSATQIGHLLLRPGHDSSWHPAPRRQWVFVLTGTMEVEAQDSEKRQFSAGDILFVEDTNGKGHQTRNADDTDVLITWVPVD